MQSTVVETTSHTLRLNMAITSDTSITSPDVREGAVSEAVFG
jgi:hypothetical protein